MTTLASLCSAHEMSKVSATDGTHVISAYECY